MLAVTSLDHINMNVINLEQSLAWYHQLFGFEVKERGTSSGGLAYAITGAPGVGYFCQYEVGPKKSEGPAVGLNHFGLHVQNFDQCLEQLKALGVEPSYGGVVDHGKSRSLYIDDPSGIEIELSEAFGGGLN